MEKKKKTWIIFLVIGILLAVMIFCCGGGIVTALIATKINNLKGSDSSSLLSDIFIQNDNANSESNSVSSGDNNSSWSDIDYDYLKGDLYDWYWPIAKNYYGDNEPILYNKELEYDYFSNSYYYGFCQLVSVNGSDSLIEFIENNQDTNAVYIDGIKKGSSYNGENGKLDHNFGIIFNSNGSCSVNIPIAPSNRIVDGMNYSEEVVFDIPISKINHSCYYNDLRGSFYENSFNESKTLNYYDWPILRGVNTSESSTITIDFNGEYRKPYFGWNDKLYTGSNGPNYSSGSTIAGTIIISINIDGCNTPYTLKYYYCCTDKKSTTDYSFDLDKENYDKWKINKIDFNKSLEETNNNNYVSKNNKPIVKRAICKIDENDRDEEYYIDFDENGFPYQELGYSYGQLYLISTYFYTDNVLSFETVREDLNSIEGWGQYEFDENGNICRELYYPADPELQSMEFYWEYLYTYDEKGEMVRYEGYRHYGDEEPNLASEKEFYYLYDENGKPIQQYGKDDNELIRDFYYDSNGLLTNVESYKQWYWPALSDDVPWQWVEQHAYFQY